MSTVQQPRERWIRDVRIRLKEDISDADREWSLEQVDPDTVEIVVGGTTSVGDYVINVEPEDGSATVPITFTRVAQTDAQIATGLAAAALVSAGAFFRAASATSATIRLAVKPGAKPFRITLVDPGTATLTLERDEIYPLSGVFTFERPACFGPSTALCVTFVAVDADDIPLEDDNACVFDFRALRIVDRHLDSDQPANWGRRPVAIAKSVLTEDAVLGEEYRVPFNGGRVAFELSALTNEPTGTAGVEIWVREAVQ